MTPSTALEVTRDAWEKAPDETLRSYHAFALFRDLGPGRTLLKAAHAIAEAEPKPRSKGARTTPEARVRALLTQLKRWSAAHDWQMRVEAYDLHLDARRRQELETERMARDRRHFATVSSLLGVAMERLAGNPKEGVEALSPTELSPADVATFVREGVKLERLIAGDPTDFVRSGAMRVGDVEKMIRDVLSILEPHVGEDRRERAAAELDFYFRTGSLPTVAA